MATQEYTNKVCAVGDFTRKLASSYLDHILTVGDDHADGGDGGTTKEPSQPSVKECFQRALESSDLLVTTNLVSNLLKAVEEHRKEQGGVAPGPGISWGEYCACCIALYTHLHETTPSARPTKPLRSKPLPPSSAVCMHEVFLGGSCNPTTWRKEGAIPTLQAASITYYNPQVDHWSPELIEIEEYAKEAAKLQLFVVDNLTRAISSMVEIGYLSGKGKDVVCVVEDIPVDQSSVIAGDTLSPREVQDLNRGRLFTRNLIEEGGCILASCLASALSDSVKIVRDKTSVSLHLKKSRHVPASIGEHLHLLSRVFSMYSNSRNGRLTLDEAELALRSLHINTPNLTQLLTRSILIETESHDLLRQYKQHGLIFDEFCLVYAELKYSLLESKKIQHSLVSNYLSGPLKWLSSWVWGGADTLSQPPPSPPPPFVDVFLNGSCGITTWRHDISIPLLKQYGVSYFNPQVSNWDRRLLPIEREAKERCSVLLYVITGETLSVASLVEAGYYIGRGRSVVLCVSDIVQSQGDTTTVEGMELSPRGVKDYNRGRAYLTSMANKNRVPVYSDISSATTCAVQLSLCLRGQKQHTQPQPFQLTTSV